MVSADDVATAVVMACRHTGEAPLAIAEPGRQLRARALAFEALRLARPEVGRAVLARTVGYRGGGGHLDTAAINTVRLCRTKDWWSDIVLDVIVGALVADQYGDRAR